MPGTNHQSQGVQQLLTAEKRAAEKVAEARKRKYIFFDVKSVSPTGVIRTDNENAIGTITVATISRPWILTQQTSLLQKKYLKNHSKLKARKYATIQTQFELVYFRNTWADPSLFFSLNNLVIEAYHLC